MFKCKFLCLLTLLCFVFPISKVNSQVGSVEIYPVDDWQAQLSDLDNITNWNIARNFQNTISLAPISENFGNNVGQTSVRSDNGAGVYRIYRVSMSFDLTQIERGTKIKNAGLMLFKTLANNNGNIDIVVTSHTRQEQSVMIKEDWNIESFGDKVFARGGLVDGGFTRLAFTDEGLNFLNDNIGRKVSLGILTEYDFSGAIPTTNRASAGWYEKEKEGFNFDPHLVIETEPLYPLYTQGTSTHPSLEETLSWTNEPYADGNVWGCKYIATCGCAITSLVMGARYHGQNEDVLGNDVNPLNINSYLIDVPGGYNDGAVNWWATQVYLGELDSEGRASSRFHYLTSVDQTTMDTYINEKHLVLGFRSADSQINRPHFVWLPEKTTNSYVVRDPFWYNTETGNDVEDLLGNVRDYNNSFTSGRVYEVYDEPIQLGSGVEAYVRGTAELLFRSTAGKVGYFDGSVTIDLDRSRYGTPDVVTLAEDTPEDSRYLLVPSSGNLFSIDVIGTDTGSFEFSIFATSDDGVVHTFELEGYTIPGIVTTFIFDLSDGTATESPITYEQFLGIMDSLLGDMTPQQRAFFERWAKKIFEDMEEKTVTQAIQSIETFGKLLVAKKLDNLVMTSVLEKLQTQAE